jgi:hypothetical protein
MTQQRQVEFEEKPGIPFEEFQGLMIRCTKNLQYAEPQEMGQILCQNLTKNLALILSKLGRFNQKQLLTFYTQIIVNDISLIATSPGISNIIIAIIQQTQPESNLFYDLCHFFNESTHTLQQPNLIYCYQQWVESFGNNLNLKELILKLLNQLDTLISFKKGHGLLRDLFETVELTSDQLYSLFTSQIFSPGHIRVFQDNCEGLQALEMLLKEMASKQQLNPVFGAISGQQLLLILQEGQYDKMLIAFLKQPSLDRGLVDRICNVILSLDAARLISHYQGSIMQMVYSVDQSFSSSLYDILQEEFNLLWGDTKNMQLVTIVLSQLGYDQQRSRLQSVKKILSKLPKNIQRTFEKNLQIVYQNLNL